MKDIVANRSRLPFRTKLRILTISVEENGFVWTFLMGIYYVASALAERSFASASNLRLRRGFPGMNSPAMNRVIWDNWDWSAKGEEWTTSAEWKQSVVVKFLEPNISKGAAIVEIGPGGGRWTGELQERASKLIGVDISEASVAECRRRFSDAENTEFWVGTGSDLEGISTASTDAIWSFDVFVHINRPQFKSYAKEFARVLRPGGIGIIQHGAVGGEKGGWRSDLTADDVRTILRSAGLEVVEQIGSWADSGEEFKAGLYDDLVTVFRRKPKEKH
jgi:ubiquinone/menaquinone biosynthesis C-methylase UbiE